MVSNCALDLAELLDVTVCRTNRAELRKLMPGEREGR